MTNEQIWDLACRSTLQKVSKAYASFPKRITGKAGLDKVMKGLYNSLSKDVLKFPIPELPKELEDNKCDQIT